MFQKRKKEEPNLNSIFWLFISVPRSRKPSFYFILFYFLFIYLFIYLLLLLLLLFFFFFFFAALNIRVISISNVYRLGTGFWHLYERPETSKIWKGYYRTLLLLSYLRMHSFMCDIRSELASQARSQSASRHDVSGACQLSAGLWLWWTEKGILSRPGLEARGCSVCHVLSRLIIYDSPTLKNSPTIKLFRVALPCFPAPKKTGIWPNPTTSGKQEIIILCRCSEINLETWSYRGCYFISHWRHRRVLIDIDMECIYTYIYIYCVYVHPRARNRYFFFFFWQYVNKFDG